MSKGMNIAPLQAFGLGDVIFCQSLANEWIELGNKVTWGVLPQFVDGLNRAYPKVTFVDYRNLPIDYERKDEHDSNGYRVVPLRWSDSLCNVPYHLCMQSKYQLFGKDVSEWRKGAMWQRDKWKEKLLLKQLGVQEGKYILVNTNYQSDSKAQALIKPDSPLRIVHMTTYQGYSLFDWALLIENAAEIHTVSTSLFYLLEMLDLSQPIHLYPRNNDPHFKHIDYLFTKPYILHK